MFYKTAGAVVVYVASSSITVSFLWDYILKPFGQTFFSKSYNWITGPPTQEDSLAEILKNYDAFEVIERTDQNGVTTRYILIENKTKITYSEPVFL